MASKTAYLALYNAAQSLGWGIVLARSIPMLLSGGHEDAHSLKDALAATFVCQLAAGLEVLHALLGLVRGGWVPALMQWAGRSHVLFCVVLPITQLHTSPFLLVLLLAWAASEVIRYPQYLCSILGYCPAWLTWLRYSAFLVLYPIGVFGGEMPLMNAARPIARQQHLYASAFRHVGFDYSQFLLSGAAASALGGITYFHLQSCAHLHTCICRFCRGYSSLLGIAVVSWCPLKREPFVNILRDENGVRNGPVFLGTPKTFEMGISLVQSGALCGARICFWRVRCWVYYAGSQAAK